MIKESFISVYTISWREPISYKKRISFEYPVKNYMVPGGRLELNWSHDH